MNAPNQAKPPAPRDSVDGIPDRAAHRPGWKYVLIAILFAAWLAVLLTLFYLGKP